MFVWFGVYVLLLLCFVLLLYWRKNKIQKQNHKKYTTKMWLFLFVIATLLRSTICEIHFVVEVSLYLSFVVVFIFFFFEFWFRFCFWVFILFTSFCFYFRILFLFLFSAGLFWVAKRSMVSIIRGYIWKGYHWQWFIRTLWGTYER